MWRVFRPEDDRAIVSMCLALNAEDPGPAPVPASQVLQTLAELRVHPARGRALVCETEGSVTAYALLISFWYNELGGEVCTIDELFVLPEYRGRGVSTSLFEKLIQGDQSLWPGRPAALALEVSPRNRARALYERLGFEGENLALRRPLKAL